MCGDSLSIYMLAYMKCFSGAQVEDELTSDISEKWS